MNHLESHLEVNTLESKIKKNLLNRLYSNVKGSKKKSFLQQTIVCLNLIYVIVLLRFSLSSMEDGGVDRTFIDCRQNQLDQMADFSAL